MDLLQIALVLLIVLLGVFLAILGIQVFFILKDLRKSLDKIDLLMSDAHIIASDLERPLKTVSDVAQAASVGAKALKEAVQKPAKPARRLFKRG